MRNIKWRSLYIIPLLLCFTNSKAQDTVSLAFNQKGELLSDLPAKIVAVDTFIIKVPVKFFNDDKKLLDKAMKNVNAQIADTNSFFYSIFKTWDAANTTRMRNDTTRMRSLYGTINSNSYSFTPSDNTFNTNPDYDLLQLFPKGFIDYYSLVGNLFNSASGANIPVPVRNNVVPFSVKVGKIENMISCVSINKTAESIIFKFKNTQAPDKDGSISYTITRIDILHQLALNHFNAIYEAKDSSIRVLKMLDTYFSKEVKELSTTIDGVVDSIALIQEFPAQTAIRKEKEDALWGKYIVIKGKLIDKIGNIDKDSTVFTQSNLLKKWILQWAWLTGGNGVLNPFKFTSADNIPGVLIDGEALKIKDFFYSRMIDSLKTFADIERMDKLVSFKQDVKKENNKITTAKAGKTANQNEITKFSTTAVNINAGTIFCSKKSSIRNYYFNKDVRADKNSFKFKYPEDNTVVLLYHNVPAGTHIEILGSYKAFDDTPDFTKFIGKAIDTIGGLYNLVSGALGGYKTLTKLQAGGNLKYQQPELSNYLLTETSSTQAVYANSTNIPYTGNFLLKSTSSIAAFSFNGSSDSNLVLNNKQFKKLQKSNPQYANKIKQDIKKGEIVTEAYENLELKTITDATSRQEKKQLILEEFIYAFDNDTTIQSIFRRNIGRVRNLNTLTLENYADSLRAVFKRITATIIIRDSITSKQRLMYKALHLLCSAKPLPSVDELTLEEITDTIPRFKSQAFLPDTKEAPYKFEYSLTKVVKSDTAKAGYLKYKTDSSYFNAGKRYRFQLAAGLAYSFAPIVRTNIDTSKNSFSVNKDENKMRIIAGVRFYLGKGIYLHDNRFIPRGKLGWLDKTSIMIGVGIPRPLDNYYIGAGYDIVPGFNINFGSHFYRYINYQVANNTIVDNSSILKVNGYVAITLDPTLFVKIFKTL
jgi:hypothetical protein